MYRAMLLFYKEEPLEGSKAKHNAIKGWPTEQSRVESRVKQKHH